MVSQQKRKAALSRWALLEMTPTCTDEIAVVPCGGCERNSNIAEIVSKVMASSYRHNTSLISLPPFIWSKGQSSRYRYLNSDHKLAISGCSENCAGRLLAKMNYEPDHELLVDEKQSTKEQEKAVYESIDILSDIEFKLFKKKGALPPASKVSRRRFAPIPVKQPEASYLEELAISERQRPTDSFSVSLVETSRHASPNDLHRNNDTSFNISLSLAGMKTSRIAETRELSCFIPPKGDELTLGEGKSYFSHRKRNNKPKLILLLSFFLLGVWILSMFVGASSVESNGIGQAQRSSSLYSSFSKRDKALLLKLKEDSSRSKVVWSALLKRSAESNYKWVGGYCHKNGQCRAKGSFCYSGVLGGMWMLTCNETCPQQNDFNKTYCINVTALQQQTRNIPKVQTIGMCFSGCDFRVFPKLGCRVGTRCARLPLSRSSKLSHRVCIPASKKTL